jgi:hypothetical protein
MIDWERSGKKCQEIRARRKLKDDELQNFCSSPNILE